MFFPYVFSYNKQYRRNTIIQEPVVQVNANPVEPNPLNSVNLVCSKTSKHGCEICKYIVISPNSICKHNYCDYCLTTRIFYVNDKCVFC
jgi:hypothetical protein